MLKIEAALADIGRLDLLARQESAIHRIDPRAKVVATLAFILCVVSVGKYELSALFPFLLYPLVLVRVGRLPLGYLFGKLALVAPFALLIGLFNPLLDRELLFFVGPIGISGGWVSFASIMMRFLLTVSAALILIATTGFNSVCLALTRLGMPGILVVQLLLLYRYIFVLADEAVRVMRAYSLRAPTSKGVPLHIYRSLAGVLLLRALDRAHRIYIAMRCRGFEGEMPLVRTLRFGFIDTAYVLAWTVFFVAARRVNLAAALGQAALEIFG